MKSRLIPVLAALVTSVLFSNASATDIPVDFGGTNLGTISVNAVSHLGINGGFQAASPLPLSSAAAIGGMDHFDWYQVVLSDTDPPADSIGNTLAAPYVDPPAGGYSNQWADNLPWYWDEQTPAPGTPNVTPGLTLSDNIISGGTALQFIDYPSDFPGNSITFKTWLVGLSPDGTGHDFFGGFSWAWTRSLSGIVTITGPDVLTAGPTPAEFDNLIGAFVPEPASSFLAFAVICLVARRPRQSA